MIFIVDDDREFAEVLKQLIAGTAPVIRCFSNVIDAINAMNETVPELIFLDVLLNGPDGFTLLNEMASYNDTGKVPIVIMSSLDFKGQDLSQYGVVGYLNKAEMTPEDVLKYVRKYATK